MPDRAGLNLARLFLAAWPDRETRTRLAEASRQVEAHWGGRPSRPETLHLTLVFIGVLERARLDTLRQALSNVRSARFELILDRLGCWRHNRIAYLAPNSPPEALLGLVTTLEACLDRLAIDFDRRPYAPHVTLARKVACADGNPDGRIEVTPMRWPVRAFDLIESVPTPAGVRYERLARLALSDPA